MSKWRLPGLAPGAASTLDHRNIYSSVRVVAAARGVGLHRLDDAVVGRSDEQRQHLR